VSSGKNTPMPKTKDQRLKLRIKSYSPMGTSSSRPSLTEFKLGFIFPGPGKSSYDSSHETSPTAHISGAAGKSVRTKAPMLLPVPVS